jgi:hypothetical protein
VVEDGVAQLVAEDELQLLGAEALDQALRRAR